MKSNKYINIEEFLQDIQLIWDNCHLYNEPGSVNTNNRSGFTKQVPKWKFTSSKQSKASFNKYSTVIVNKIKVV